jgi:hypothetical protein
MSFSVLALLGNKKILCGRVREFYIDQAFDIKFLVYVMTIFEKIRFIVLVKNVPVSFLVFFEFLVQRGVWVSLISGNYGQRLGFVCIVPFEIPNPPSYFFLALELFHRAGRVLLSVAIG